MVGIDVKLATVTNFKAGLSRRYLDSGQLSVVRRAHFVGHKANRGVAFEVLRFALCSIRMKSYVIDD